MHISNCPSCQRELRMPDETIGKKVRCPGCQTVFVAQSAPPITAEPEAPSPSPPAPTSKPEASGNPFNFDDADAARTNETDGDESDQSLEITTPIRGNSAIGSRARTIALMMNVGAGLMILIVLARLTWFMILAIQRREQVGPDIFIFGCLQSFFFLTPMVILSGAGSLARLRSKGWSITAAIFSLFLGITALISMAPLGFLLFRIFNAQGAAITWALGYYLIVGLAYFVAAIICFASGLWAILFVCRADVTAAFPNHSIAVRARSVAGMLKVGAWLMVLIGLIVLTGSILRGRTEAPQVLTACCLGSFLFLILTVIFSGAGSLARLQSKGWSMTAGILSLILGIFVLTVVAGFGFHSLRMFTGQGGPIDQTVGLLICLELVYFTEAIICFWGGQRAILFVSRADVTEAFRAAREKEEGRGDPIVN